MTSNFPRVLLVTRNLPPLLGGMERLNQRLVEILASDHQVTVVGPEGSAMSLPRGVETCEIPLRPLWRFLAQALLASVRLARSRRVGLVFAGSGLAAPIAWVAARASGARSVVYVHGLDLMVPSRPYRLLWLPFIRRSDLVLANSANTARLAVEQGVPKERIAVLNPGTELPGIDDRDRAEFRARHGLGDRPLLLSVGRMTPRKGLVEFVEQALPAVLKQYPDALFLVIGSEASDALHGHGGGQIGRLEEAARRAGVSEAVRRLPSCSDTELSAAYRAADVHVFPVREMPGDVEGFGMVAVEAAAHGLPTVGFAVGGVPDAIVENVTGNLAPAADQASLAALVGQWLSMRQDASARSRCADAARIFGWDRFAQKLARELAILAGGSA